MEKQDRNKVINEFFELILENYNLLDINSYSIERKNVRFKSEDGFPSAYEEGIYLECGSEPHIKFSPEESKLFRKIFDGIVLTKYIKSQQNKEYSYVDRLKKFVDKNKNAAS